MKKQLGDNTEKTNLRGELEKGVSSALVTLFELSQTAQNESVRLSACKDILDRSAYEEEKAKKNSEDKSVIVHIIRYSDTLPTQEKTGL